MTKIKLQKVFKQVLMLLSIVLPQFLQSQALLEADGPGNTYELINSILAPGADVVEHPECVHPEFGRHITEVWDADLNQYVFEFNIHVTPDNDRCINFDRQRMEIKTYAASPDNLIGTTGETIDYKWKFKLPVGFQPSSNFTHLHQIKAVDGSDDMPIFTLTARMKSINQLELIHNNTDKLASVDLSLFEGKWVEVNERIKVDSIHGTYSIDIKNATSGATILTYSNNDLMTIRSDNSFIRPKWGIYRSLLNSQDLRDEAVRFNSFYIYEEPKTKLNSTLLNDATNLKLTTNSVLKTFTLEYNLQVQDTISIDILNSNGQILKNLIDAEIQEKGKHIKQINSLYLKTGLYFVCLHSSTFNKTIKLII